MVDATVPENDLASKRLGFSLYVDRDQLNNRN